MRALREFAGLIGISSIRCVWPARFPSGRGLLEHFQWSADRKLPRSVTVA
jgi:hypothetical protein